MSRPIENKIEVEKGRAGPNKFQSTKLLEKCPYRGHGTKKLQLGLERIPNAKSKSKIGKGHQTLKFMVICPI